MSIPTITVNELKERRDKKQPHVLLDVREPDEHETCRIEGSMLIPLGQLPSRLAELPNDKEIVVHCHHGGRSARAAGFLIQQGFTAKNLAGGIDAWSEQIDQDVPRY
jgi:sulfur-carrier protein adenylyltransferase/sulfurtransferase